VLRIKVYGLTGWLSRQGLASLQNLQPRLPWLPHILGLGTSTRNTTSLENVDIPKKKLSVQIADIDRVHVNNMDILNPNNARFDRISQPKPPAPITSILHSSRRNFLTWQWKVQHLVRHEQITTYSVARQKWRSVRGPGLSKTWSTWNIGLASHHIFAPIRLWDCCCMKC